MSSSRPFIWLEDEPVSCRQSRRQISAWIDGELPQAAAEAVATHVQRCPDCAVHAQELRRIADALSTWDAPPLPDSLAERIRRAAEDLPAPAIQLRTWRRHHWMGRVAAVLLVGVGFAAGMLAAPSRASALQPIDTSPAVASIDAYDILAEGTLTDMMLRTLEDPAIEEGLL
jgi:anti-sigma factor RsiW